MNETKLTLFSHPLVCDLLDLLYMTSYAVRVQLQRVFSFFRIFEYVYRR